MLLNVYCFVLTFRKVLIICSQWVKLSRNIFFDAHQQIVVLLRIIKPEALRAEWVVISCPLHLLSPRIFLKSSTGYQDMVFVPL